MGRPFAARMRRDQAPHPCRAGRGPALCLTVMPRSRWKVGADRFRQWRDGGVFEALPQGLIAEAAKRGAVNLSLVRVDSCSCTYRWPSTACVLQW